MGELDLGEVKVRVWKVAVSISGFSEPVNTLNGFWIAFSGSGVGDATLLVRKGGLAIPSISNQFGCNAIQPPSLPPSSTMPACSAKAA